MKGTVLVSGTRYRKLPSSPAFSVSRIASPALRAVRAVLLDAVGVEMELVVVDGEAPLARHLLLALLDLGVVELLDAPALPAHEVIVVRALVQLVDRLAALEVMAHEEPRLLELSEHAIHGGEPDVRVIVE